MIRRLRARDLMTSEPTALGILTISDYRYAAAGELPDDPTKVILQLQATGRSTNWQPSPTFIRIRAVSWDSYRHSEPVRVPPHD